MTAATLYEVDLHCHTIASDGLLSPKELVRSAAEMKLRGIGITDHDTIQGWQEAEEAGAYYGIEILKGIELNTNWQGKEVHILGYEPDPSSADFFQKLLQLRNAREQRINTIIGRLEDLGIRITKEEVRQRAPGESVGRPHIAQVLIERGYVGSVREAFDRYIGIGKPAYVPLAKITTEEGVAMIRDAHGIPVLAHPGKQRIGREMASLIEFGLRGIEVVHSEHTPEDVAFYQRLAGDYHLIMTGGSDFHGEARKPGVPLGGWGTSLAVMQSIKKMAQER